MMTTSSTQGRKHLVPQRAWPLLSVGFVLCSAIAVASPANAAAAAGPPISSSGLPKTVTVEMQQVGFDAAVAKAHGYMIITVNGRQMSVKASGGVAPDNSTPPPVSNSCATVTLSAYYQGNRKESFYWDVRSHNAPIYQYNFPMTVSDSKGTGSKTFYDFLLADEEVAGNWKNTKHSVYGSVVAKFSGEITTLNGTICKIPNASVGDWMS